MTKFSTTILAWLLVVASAQAQDFATDKLSHWHQWRGPNADGVAPNANPPLQWSEKENVRWKVPIPGAGSATPVVWGNRVFVLTAIDTGRTPDNAGAANKNAPAPADRADNNKGGGKKGGGDLSSPTPTTLHAFDILCLDINSGAVLWRKTATEEVPHEGHHATNAYASASPVTDGRKLYASFGSRGIYCYDMDGNFQWKRDLGDMQTKRGFGEGASPALHADKLVVNWDHDAGSFITCLDAATGRDRWKVPRDETTTWTTPLIVPHKGKVQVVVNATNRVRSYDLATGEELWQCGGQTTNAISSPVVRGGTVYCMTGFRGNAVYAIPLDSRGDITGTNKIAWHYDKAGPYIASPLLYDNLLYFTKERNGILACLNADTGQELYANQRLEGISVLYGSPVGRSGKVYIADRDGATAIVRHGPKYELLATNKLDETIDASPVPVGTKLLLRGQKHLYCIGDN